MKVYSNDNFNHTPSKCTHITPSCCACTTCQTENDTSKTDPRTNMPSTLPPLQIFKGNHLQNNAESQISAMAYLDLILRSVTEPGLLQVFIRFLLDADKFDGQRILDVLVDRINSVDTRVSFSKLFTFIAFKFAFLSALLGYVVAFRYAALVTQRKSNARASAEVPCAV